jgi:transcription elongation GreA/GreB family factor
MKTETTRTTVDLKTKIYLKYKRKALSENTSAKKLIEQIIENAIIPPKKQSEEVK